MEEEIGKLTKDLRESGKLLDRAEVRYLVDAYYQLQEARITAANRVRIQGEAEEPIALFVHFSTQYKKLENQAKSALNQYAKSVPTGQWALAQRGIGPVITAGLLSEINIDRCTSLSPIISFAGLAPGQQWLGREKATKLVDLAAQTGDLLPKLEELIGRKVPIHLPRSKDETVLREDATVADLKKWASRRPWNARLKVLSFKIGDCFMKSRNGPDGLSYYGRIYETWKAEYQRRSESGELAEKALQELQDKNYSKTTEAYKAYANGRYPAGRIEMMARRKAVHRFLIHFGWVLWETTYNLAVPRPWVQAHGEHTDIDPPPGHVCL